MATAFSALTRAAGTAGWMGTGGISGDTGTGGVSGCIAGVTGVPGCTGGSGCFAKKSAASVTTGSCTMGWGAGFGAGRSGSCPKVPPGPTISGSMGSLPPAFTSEGSGPRSTSKGARGRDALTLTGVMTGEAGSGCGAACAPG